MVSYRGPIRPVGTDNANQPIAARLVQIVTAASDIAGVLFVPLNNNPAGALDFAAYQALYLDCRTLAFKVTWVPFSHNFSGQAVPLVQTPLVTYFLRVPVATSPGTYTNAWDNDAARVRPIDSQFSEMIHMNGTPDATWQDTAATSATCAYGAFAASLSVSSTYGQFYIEYLVQFRSRQ